MKKLLRLLFGPAALSLLAALSVALLIWIGGPLLAFAGWHPLESEIARIAVIVALLVLWLGKRVARKLRAKLANNRLFDALGSRSQASPAAAEDPERFEVVRQRFSEAVATMKSFRPASRAGLVARALGDKRYVYQLPWYLFIGPPGSGKTTALLNSGLKFPLADRLGNEPIRGVGGTRNCDWWFTDQAVLIDTAGRYTTQDSDAETDAKEWREFLALLRKHRPRQPINGALVTVSVSDLLQLSPRELEAQANAVRNRLQELSTTLGNEFPVYLLVTKTDLLAGFVEFFGHFDREQREQVWGSTFEYRPNGPNEVDPDTFSARFQELVKHVDDLTLERLQTEQDPSRRAAIFGFARQLAGIGPALSSFAETAFPATKLARAPILRGVYLTSGTQEGTPIDRVVGALARQFGLQRGPTPALQPSGRAYFLTRLLNQVIFPEAGLAGTNLRWERRLATGKWVASVSALVIAGVALVGWSISYLNNSRYLDAVDQKTAALKEAISGRVADSIDLPTLLPIYAAVRALPTTYSVSPEHPRVDQGLGLFQAPKIAEAADQAYHRLLEQTLAPAIAARIAAVLRSGAANPELRYETLKTYLMMRDPAHLDREAIRGWVAFDLDTDQTLALSAGERRELLAHVDAMLARNGFQDAVVADEALIARTRSALLRTSFPQRAYDRLKRQGIGDFPEFRISNAAGPTAAAVFTRPSGKSLNEGVPGFYSYDAYHKGFVKALDAVVRTLAAEEVWVLGLTDSENARRATDLQGREELADQVKRLYLQDYARQWEQFVGDIALVRGDSLSDTIQTARLLSAPDSPLPPLLRAIVREVSLTEKEGEPSAVEKAVDKATGAVRGTRETLTRLLGAGAAAAAAAQPAGTPIESIVDDRFEHLRRLVRGPPGGGGTPPIDQTIALINELYELMSTTETVVRSGGAPPSNTVIDKVKIDAARLPEPVRSMLGSLAAGGANQALGATRANISRSMASSVGEFCAQAINGRYPFVPGSKQDVTPDDFARLFAAGGVLDAFFQQHLAAHVDTSRKPWKFRTVGSSTMGDSASLIQFQRAAEIRDVFFGGGARGPALRIQMKPVEMDPAILQFSLDVDGQILRYAHGPSVSQALQWPGPKGSNQIRIQASPPGPSGASGLVFEGPWALYRMFDQARIESAAQPERFRADFAIDGRHVLFDVTTSSVRNPFRLPELQAFRCPSRL